MQYFDCNAPGTTGYSVATDGVSIFHIQAHHLDDDVRFYKDVGPELEWIYMPLDEGEYLIEICRRYGSYIYEDAFGLMVRFPAPFLSTRLMRSVVHHQSRTYCPIRVLYTKARETRCQDRL